jgi:hypothetical protein
MMQLIAAVRHVDLPNQCAVGSGRWIHIDDTDGLRTACLLWIQERDKRELFRRRFNRQLW